VAAAHMVYGQRSWRKYDYCKTSLRQADTSILPMQQRITLWAASPHSHSAALESMNHQESNICLMMVIEVASRRAQQAWPWHCRGAANAPRDAIEDANDVVQGVVKELRACALAAIMATESEGVMKNFFPRIMFRSPSPSLAAPKSGPSSAHITSTSSFAYLHDPFTAGSAACVCEVLHGCMLAHGLRTTDTMLPGPCRVEH
jgi:hypothetical protein